MAELIPAPFADLVTRLYTEPRVNDSAFALPRRKWYAAPAGQELSVSFHGRHVATPAGPAAGPHTQMAQNLVLGYLAGGRVLELKTVQVNDRLTIPRPCIDMQTIGYNVEWSQELLVEQSLREYVAGMMLIEITKCDPFFGVGGDYVLDMSVGYDLAGIRSPRVQGFLDGMRDASALIEKLRAQIPPEYRLARELNYPREISATLTLSTFHGCPAGEIESICEFLIGERGLDVIVKMNPPMLGRQRLEHLLYNVMGYHELKVNPAAYTSGLQFDEAAHLVRRLETFARTRGRRMGCKFSNTLEVENHRDFFTPDNKLQYLSGQPLHVITMALADEFRRTIGPEMPFSFSAGIDRHNFASAVACGFVPVSVCSDLLRPGGYGRMSAYMAALAEAMKAVGARTVDDLILDAYGQRTAAGGDVNRAAMLNLSIAARRAEEEPRYRAEANRKPPPRIDSHLTLFDCITCDKCIPVCPNNAIFEYPSKIAEQKKPMQIGIYADFCNECGNCDTFCPEHGGPYKQKPLFFGGRESWLAAAPRDGFFIDGETIHARLAGRVCSLKRGEHLDDRALEQTLLALLDGARDASRVHMVSVRPNR